LLADALRLLLLDPQMGAEAGAVIVQLGLRTTRTVKLQVPVLLQPSVAEQVTVTVEPTGYGAFMAWLSLRVQVTGTEPEQLSVAEGVGMFRAEPSQTVMLLPGTLQLTTGA
jgi:hypothetical protein